MSFRNITNQASLAKARIEGSSEIIFSKLRNKLNSAITAKQAEFLAKFAVEWQQKEHNLRQSGASAFKANGGAYRPSQWDNPELVYAKTDVGGYFFDAIIKAEHSSSLRITEHPVQTGASVSDHAYLLPARLTLEIGMSDCMDSVIAGQFISHQSKSVSAYQTLIKLQADRTPLSITTRLKSYENMLIEHIHAPDDVKTLYGLKCSVSFKQIFVADVSTVVVSARANVTASPKSTVVQPTMPDNTVASKIETAVFGTQPVEMAKSH